MKQHSSVCLSFRSCFSQLTCKCSQRLVLRALRSAGPVPGFIYGPPTAPTDPRLISHSSTRQDGQQAQVAISTERASLQRRVEYSPRLVECGGAKSVCPYVRLLKARRWDSTHSMGLDDQMHLLTKCRKKTILEEKKREGSKGCIHDDDCIRYA